MCHVQYRRLWQRVHLVQLFQQQHQLMTLFSGVSAVLYVLTGARRDGVREYQVHTDHTTRWYSTTLASAGVQLGCVTGDLGSDTGSSRGTVLRRAHGYCTVLNVVPSDPQPAGSS